MLSLSEIQEAKNYIKSSKFCCETSISEYDTSIFGLKWNCQLWLKNEGIQPTGSFKVRGVCNQLRHLPKGVGTEKRKLVTMSAGNYGKAFATFCGALKLSGLVLLPETAPASRRQFIENLGVSTELHPVSKLQDTVDRYVREHAMHFLHPFDDLHLIAGYGTIGLEILSECSPDIVLVCCGGGGVLAGTAAAIRLMGHPDVRIYGVEPEGANTMWESFQQGHAVTNLNVKTIAAGLAPPYAGTNTYRLCKEYVNGILLVSDEEIRHAVRVLHTNGLWVEPSGAAAMAALMSGRVPPPIDGAKVCVLVTGSNISEQEMEEL